MEKTFGEKLKELLKAEGWTQEFLAKKLGFKQQAVANYLADRRFPRKETLEKLAGAFGKSTSYFYDDAPAERASTPPPVSVVIRAASLKILSDLPERRTELVEVPIVNGSIAAGSGRIPDDTVEDWAWLPVSQLHGHSRENLVCVRITGESMEPIIRTGAIVCVDRAVRTTGKKHIDRSVYAVRTGAEGVSVKYVRITDHIMALLSANLEQAPIMVDLRTQPSPVIGRVVWMWQPME